MMTLSLCSRRFQSPSRGFRITGLSSIFGRPLHFTLDSRNGTAMASHDSLVATDVRGPVRLSADCEPVKDADDEVRQTSSGLVFH